MAHIHYCNTKSPEWQTFYETFNAEYYATARTANKGDTTLYIDCQYRVLYNTSSQKLDRSYIVACHKALNEAFTNKNTSEMDKIPENSLYPWKSRLGNPNIQFLPLNAEDLKVQYISISENSLNDDEPVAHASELGGISDGMMNIYIGNQEAGILGQAYLGGNEVFILYSSVGGPDKPGQLSEYGLGKTLIHEVGHALSLPHTFSDDSCDGNTVFPDVPEQIAPNFDTQLVQEGGAWTCKNDNRYDDRKYSTNYSCLHVDNATNEMGINYMDYGVDDVSIMFTESQVLMMRAWLVSPGAKSYLTLRSATDASKATETPGDNEGVSGSGLADVFGSKNIGIAVIVVASIVGALIIGYLIYHWKFKKKTEHISTRLSDRYGMDMLNTPRLSGPYDIE